jgi:exodeoxyribonuclease III
VIDEVREPAELRLRGPLAVRSASVQTLRLVTWNVQRSAPSRARAQAAWLAAFEDADVVALTEVGDSSGGRALGAALAELGYAVLVPEAAGGGYGVVLASRVGELERIPIELLHLPRRVLAGRLTIGPCVVGLVGLYVPSRGPAERRNADKRLFQDAITALLPGLGDTLGCATIVVAGDLNVIEPGHQPHHPLFGEWEYAFYAQFGEVGLVDAFRALHPNIVDHSWFGRSGSGYRFDHIFVSRTARDQVRRCQYVHGPRLAGLSDHAPMSMTLELRS